MEKALFTFSEFCDIANIGKTKAYEILANGDVKAVKVGRKTMIPRSAIEEWMGTLPSFQKINDGAAMNR